jgi:hypothetical protein
MTRSVTSETRSSALAAGGIAAHERPARDGEADEPARDVRVHGGGHDAGAAVPREVEDLRPGLAAVGDDQHGDAELDRLALGLRAVPDDGDVALAERQPLEVVHLHGQDPQAARHLRSSPTRTSRRGRRRSRPGTRGGPRSSTRRASRAGTGGRGRARSGPHERAVLVHDGREVDLLLGHPQADVPHGLGCRAR